MAAGVESYECVRYWLSNVTRTTQALYGRWFRHFCAITGESPDELLAEASVDRRKMHMKVKEFYLRLKSQGYASNTRNQAYTSLRSFFSYNDCFLGRMPKHFKGVSEFAPHRVISPRDIFSMIVAAPSIRDKAIVSFLGQSGQRVGILSALRYGHVRSRLEKGENPLVVEVKGELKNAEGVNVNKYMHHYHFAVGKEAADLVRQMILIRRSKGELIDDNSWLFRSNGRENRPGSWSCAGPSKGRSAGRWMSPERLRGVVVKVALDAGVQSKQEFKTKRIASGVMYDIHPHAFRRWFRSRMRLAGIHDFGLVSYMMGHLTLAFPYQGAYDVYDEDYVRREYAKVEPFLSVMPATSDGRDVVKPSQQIVNEAELEQFLGRGWHFVTTLPSGRLIVENPGL